SLDGHTALVTGASGGLGRHFADVLARAGAKVAITARRVDALASVREALAGTGAHVDAFALDVTDPQSVAEAFERAAQELGPGTVVINNAGVAVTKPLLDQ